jgi:ribosome maturation factor RimP
MARMQKKKGRKSTAGSAAVSLTRAEEQKTIDQVWRLTEPLCAAEGVSLIHVEYQRESTGRVLRLYIERPGGVSLDDCVQVNRMVSDLLDISLDNDHPYNLEISSPGLDRPLGKPEDYDRFTGHRARVRTWQAIDGRRNFTGTLEGLQEGNAVRIRIEKETRTIPLEAIKTARLVNYNGEPPC